MIHTQRLILRKQNLEPQILEHVQIKSLHPTGLFAPLFCLFAFFVCFLLFFHILSLCLSPEIFSWKFSKIYYKLQKMFLKLIFFLIFKQLFCRNSIQICNNFFWFNSIFKGEFLYNLFAIKCSGSKIRIIVLGGFYNCD